MDLPEAWEDPPEADKLTATLPAYGGFTSSSPDLSGSWLAAIRHK